MSDRTTARVETRQITWIDQDGLLCPHFACCVCGEPITDPEGVMVEWRYDDSFPVVVDWRVCHKGACDHSRPRDHHWYWGDLGPFLGQILFNLGLKDASQHVFTKHPSPEMRLEIDPAPRKSRPVVQVESKAKVKRSISPRRRYAILQRDGFKCGLCGRTADQGVELHVDHQQPVSKGGSNGDENLWTLCADCNLGKSDRL